MSQTYRRKYIIYVIMAVTVSGLRGCLVCSPASLTVLWQFRHWQLTPPPSPLQVFLFYSGFYYWRLKSTPKWVKTGSQMSIPPHCSWETAGPWHWSLRRWGPASFLFEGPQLPLDTEEIIQKCTFNVTTVSQHTKVSSSTSTTLCCVVLLLLVTCCL